MAKTAQELAAEYKESFSSSSEQHQVLLYGGIGAGKTYSLRTFRLPIWVDSFDPGGSGCLTSLVEEGNAVVVTSYETESFDNPTAFRAWERDFQQRAKDNIFSSIGTYCIDSATTWAQAAMNVVLKERGAAGKVPQQNDWYPQMILMEKAVRLILSLPCDIVFVCHDDVEKDVITESICRYPLLTGKLTKRIPLLFSEVYFATTQRTSKGTEYVWQTSPDHQVGCAKSRQASLVSSNSKQTVEKFEKANFKELAKKWGGLREDLPPLK